MNKCSEFDLDMLLDGIGGVWCKDVLVGDAADEDVVEIHWKEWIVVGKVVR